MEDKKAERRQGKELQRAPMGTNAICPMLMCSYLLHIVRPCLFIHATFRLIRALHHAASSCSGFFFFFRYYNVQPHIIRLILDIIITQRETSTFVR